MGLLLVAFVRVLQLGRQKEKATKEEIAALRTSEPSINELLPD